MSTKPRATAADGAPIKRGATLYLRGCKTLGVASEQIQIVGFRNVASYASGEWNVPESTWVRYRREGETRTAGTIVHPSALRAAPWSIEDAA